MKKPEPVAATPPLLAPHVNHSRLFQLNRFVYPVLSRRSRGISVGINLNPDKICNFDCVYCQVDRGVSPLTTTVDPDRLLSELEHTLDLITSGNLYEEPRFSQVPTELRRLNDIAFSGDGEPTTYPQFSRLVEEVAFVKRRRGMDEVKLILITNASRFHRPAVRKALAILDDNHGEIWAKLDAGTEAYYQTIARTAIPFQRILTNLLEAARIRPLVIQSLFMNVDGRGPSRHEIRDYVQRLMELTNSGGMLSRIQVYTTARPTSESIVSPLSPFELCRIAESLRQRLDVQVEVFQGAKNGP